MSAGALLSPAAAARCTTVSTPANAGRMASRSPRSARWQSTPGTARRFSPRSVYTPSMCARSAPPMRPLSPVTRTQRGATPGLALQLAVEPEVVRDRRPPPVERVGLQEVARLPSALLGDVVEVVEAHGVVAPRLVD